MHWAGAQQLLPRQETAAHTGPPAPPPGMLIIIPPARACVASPQIGCRQFTRCKHNLPTINTKTSPKNSALSGLEGNLQSSPHPPAPPGWKTASTRSPARPNLSRNRSRNPLGTVPGGSLRGAREASGETMPQAPCHHSTRPASARCPPHGCRQGLEGRPGEAVFSGGPHGWGGGRGRDSSAGPRLRSTCQKQSRRWAQGPFQSLWPKTGIL